MEVVLRKRLRISNQYLKMYIKACKSRYIDEFNDEEKQLIIFLQFVLYMRKLYDIINKMTWWWVMLL